MATVLRHEWDFVLQIAESCGVAHGERQDVALEVFYRYDQYRWSISSPAAIRSWLRTTAVHVAADVKNRGTSRYEIPVDPESLEPENVAPSPEEQMSALEGHRALLALVDALEPGRREVFRRYADQHQAMSLLSSELRIPQGTAYNRLRLAREELKEALTRQARTKDRETVPRPSKHSPSPTSTRVRPKKRRSSGLVSFLLLVQLEFLDRVARFLSDVWEWLLARAGYGRALRAEWALRAGWALRAEWAPIHLTASVVVAAVTAVSGLPGFSRLAPASVPLVASGAGVSAPRGAEHEPPGVDPRQHVSPKEAVSEKQRVSCEQPDPSTLGVSCEHEELGSQGVFTPPDTSLRNRREAMRAHAVSNDLTPPGQRTETALLEPRTPDEDPLAARAAHMRLSLRTAHARLAAFSKRPPSPAPPRPSNEPLPGAQTDPETHPPLHHP